MRKTRSQLIAKIAEQHRQRCLAAHHHSQATGADGTPDAAVLVANAEVPLVRTAVGGVTTHRYRYDGLNPAANQVTVLFIPAFSNTLLDRKVLSQAQTVFQSSYSGYFLKYGVV